jgi:hypothetical protein
MLVDLRADHARYRTSSGQRMPETVGCKLLEVLVRLIVIA